MRSLPHYNQSSMAFALATSPPPCFHCGRTGTARFKRPRGAQGWCAGPGKKTEINGAWQQREDARRCLRAESYKKKLRSVVKLAGKNLWKARKSAVLSVFWVFVRKLEGDQAGLYKHLKPMSLEGKRNRSLAHIKDEDGILEKRVELIRER